MGVGEAGGTGGTEGEADAFGGREGSVHRFAAAWVRVRAAFGEGSCVLRETIRKGRPRFCWLSLYAPLSLYNPPHSLVLRISARR